MKRCVVVGLDISITGTGLACSAHPRTHLIGAKGITKLPIDQRAKVLSGLCADIVLWTELQEPVLVAIEAPAYAQSGGGAVERHYLYMAVITQLVGRRIPVAEVNVSKRIKYALGKGVGPKTAIADAVARRFPDYDTAGNDNRCDAVILAAMGADHLGQPITTMPQIHRDALDGVHWPINIGDPT
ncbi:hypothetical protein Rhe02_55460 [Rhizocola hellebori]|uniref:Uncharacterized protein n=1 Tax=Rhizocola hellebori TaxID=1392758 RepID=A0A8J3VHK0_9ACTN|nr:hypothetical protein [Rhizocola hellebori]GIH07479.1 hypothetical protein Rhe02_55460 [Rhizocola hellebori]